MSELERIRDENIRRNEEFLKSLGLNDIKPKPLETLKDDLIKNKKKEKKSKRIKKESSTNIMIFLVQDLLDYAQIKAGKFRKNLELFNIRDAVEQVMCIQR